MDGGVWGVWGIGTSSLNCATDESGHIGTWKKMNSKKMSTFISNKHENFRLDHKIDCCSSSFCCSCFFYSCSSSSCSFYSSSSCLSWPGSPKKCSRYLRALAKLNGSQLAVTFISSSSCSSPCCSSFTFVVTWSN